MSCLSLRVFLLRILCFSLILVGFTATAQRQKAPTKSRKGSSIVNDSSKSVYGPKTSKWTTEKDLFENRPNFRPIDTTVYNYHRWTYVQRFNYHFKDLGAMGTALSPIFPLMATSLGAWAGFTAYEPYYATQDPHLFDTKSPMTRMRVIWGGSGQAMTEVEFSRNISPRWNFGFNYRPILSDKQIQRSGKGDRIVVSQYYDFNTTYFTKNKKYFLLFSFRRIRHRVNENGGIVLSTGDDFIKNFDPNAKINLLAAKTEEYRRNIHVFHQFQLAKPLQLYHMMDFTKQNNGFADDLTKDPKSYFDYNQNLSADTTKSDDQYTFTSMQQEVGIKGNANKLFYSAYYKFRTYDYSSQHLDTITTSIQKSGTENYLGGRLSLKLDSVSEISGSAEYLLAGYYRIEGQIQTPWIEGYFKSSLSKPGFMQMLYRGAHDYWNHSFVGINTTQAQGFLKFNNKFIQLRAGGTVSLIKNYVYFKEEVATDPKDTQTVLPYQASGTHTILSPELRMSIPIVRNLYLRPQVIYTSVLNNEDDAFQIPQVFVNTQIAYENSHFKNHIQMQTGLDIHWHSAYQALGYDPAIQTFYVQTTTVIPAFPVVDVFFTGKMGWARFFFKYHNLVQTFKKTGYFITAPNYPGTRNLIDFGFEFLLFD